MPFFGRSNHWGSRRHGSGEFQDRPSRPSHRADRSFLNERRRGSSFDSGYGSARSSADISRANSYERRRPRHDSRHEPSYSSRRSHSPPNSQRFRDVSPPSCPEEYPRLSETGYYHHRDVSPLGSSRFERPSLWSSYSSGHTRQPRVEDYRPQEDYHPQEDYRSRPSRSLGDSMQRMNAVRGRPFERLSRRPTYEPEYGTREARAGLVRRPDMYSRAQTSSNFSGREVGGWELF
ncbi:hypothetical protein BS50DRAFT_227328 [Corynespora cassiicola Philippines]|uniref:Uncharacterized protein n=1 Tax=Corynespora cassiicola Philippines TaxID=1448308 RepID=A0A2T2N2F3_CORCC|nr:hypothetical protein BS50DRAFT_227328 [Corynespora cassiicola Philippines]